MQPGAAVPLAARAVALLGALVFAASLGYFLFSYAMTFGEPVPRGAAAAGRAVAVDAALFTAFALHHSVFARTRVRAWVARAVPPSLERSLYVWVASVLFILVCAWWQPVPGTVWHIGGGWRWGLLALQGAAIWIVLRSAAIIDVLDLAGVRQVLSPPRPDGLRSDGPYGWVRHPIYTGWFLLVFAVPVMTMTRFVFATISCAYLVAAIPLEERTLREASGGAYAEYARRVRWRMLPGIY